MEILEKIFGSAAKVKIMRLFLFSPGEMFDIALVAKRTKSSPKTAAQEIKQLEEISLLKSRIFSKEVWVTKKIRSKSRRGPNKGKVQLKKNKVMARVRGWTLNESFPYLKSLQGLLIHVSAFQPKELIKKVNRMGKIKLLLVAGVFTQNPDSRLDLLVVGDNIKKSAVETAAKNIEADLGRQITYSVFETADFKYRLGMFDKLIRDVLDFPHQKLIDKIGINW